MVGGLLHADLLSRKQLTEIDLASLIANAATAGHHGRPIVKRTIELLEAPIRAGPRACSSWPTSTRESGATVKGGERAAWGCRFIVESPVELRQAAGMSSTRLPVGGLAKNLGSQIL